MTAKLWGGRFRKEQDKRALLYSQSITFDYRLYPYDIGGSIAYAKMLGRCGFIKKKDTDAIEKALSDILAQMDAEKFSFDIDLEDIHTNIEAALVTRVGADIGGRLHTGRSRNDQVALDMRMYVKDEALEIRGGLQQVRRALIAQAEKNLDAVMPGFTHLQHAQPVLLAHHLLAYNEMLVRDEERFLKAYEAADVMPLGSAALAGTSFQIDRQFLAKELNFAKLSNNSIDAVSDRDYLIELLSACATFMMHISRLSEELILWSSSEFGFVEMDDAFTTGSSIMPQKKNPDIAELARARTAKVYGNLMTLLCLMKGLPLAYNRDLQEDKPCVFDSVDIVRDTLDVFAPMIETLVVNAKRMEQECKAGFLNATDLADYLVKKDVPFRQAHAIVGKVVSFCIRENAAIEDLPLEKLQEFSPLFQKDVYKEISLAAVINSRRAPGGTARPNVLKAIRRAKKDLGME
ncbi:MAG: argininosuccinate lyase [Candidatus Abyssobacteria bacterium SURF_5]|uniref:Argininosuccinate lyase n=1 Tax=Abyssobacteria bacterium (strain SURF_5) TaxID=2093360 RepID=A0A3A4NM47_ABYX5|nr:MAG: argininosuccinate lyase [Candidatus Abyssubacteria bacterium SURF_5]